MLKIFIIIIAIILAIIIFFYAFIKIRYNINIFSAINQFKAFGKTPEVSRIIDYAIEDQDLTRALEIFDNAGLGFIYTTDTDGNISVDPTKIPTTPPTLSQDIQLSDKQIGAVANNYLNSFIKDVASEEGEIFVDKIEVVQLRFSDIQMLAGSMTSAKVNFIVKVDLTKLKNSFNTFPLTLIKNYIPNMLYISSTNTITKTADFIATVDYNELKINNLSAKSTASIINILNNIMGIGTSEQIGKEIGKYVCDTLIGNTKSPEGFAYALNPVGVQGCNFSYQEETGYFIFTI